MKINWFLVRTMLWGSLGFGLLTLLISDIGIDLIYKHSNHEAYSLVAGVIVTIIFFIKFAMENKVKYGEYFDR
jgi:Trk-type K+ transport system membrane component